MPKGTPKGQKRDRVNQKQEDPKGGSKATGPGWGLFPPKKKKCPYCGTKNLMANAVCVHCNANFLDTPITDNVEYYGDNE